jgi:hypothetical protein
VDELVRLPGRTLLEGFVLGRLALCFRAWSQGVPGLAGGGAEVID